jgi:hypothetical protein
VDPGGLWSCSTLPAALKRQRRRLEQLKACLRLAWDPAPRKSCNCRQAPEKMTNTNMLWTLVAFGVAAPYPRRHKGKGGGRSNLMVLALFAAGATATAALRSNGLLVGRAFCSGLRLPLALNDGAQVVLARFAGGGCRGGPVLARFAGGGIGGGLGFFFP